MNSNTGSDWPSTLTEAVDRLMSTLSPKQIDAIRHIPHADLITLHFSLGMSIRNTFGLWKENDDLLRACFPDASDPYLREIVMHDPDRASGVIVKALWERLRLS